MLYTVAVLLLFLSSITAAQQFVCTSIGLSAKTKAVPFEITVSKAVFKKASIQFHYTLHNTSQYDVYVYDPFLDGPLFAIDVRGAVTVFGTAPLQINSGTAYDSPDPTFLKLEPGQIERRTYDTGNIPVTLRRTRMRPQVAIAVGITTGSPEILEKLTAQSIRSCAEDPKNVLARALELVVSPPVTPKR